MTAARRTKMSSRPSAGNCRNKVAAAVSWPRSRSIQTGVSVRPRSRTRRPGMRAAVHPRARRAHVQEDRQQAGCPCALRHGSRPGWHSTCADVAQGATVMPHQARLRSCDGRIESPCASPKTPRLRSARSLTPSAVAEKITDHRHHGVVGMKCLLRQFQEAPLVDSH